MKAFYQPMIDMAKKRAEAEEKAKMKKNKEATAKIYQQYRDSTGVKDLAK